MKANFVPRGNPEGYVSLMRVKCELSMLYFRTSSATINITPFHKCQWSSSIRWACVTISEVDVWIIPSLVVREQNWSVYAVLMWNECLNNNHAIIRKKSWGTRLVLVISDLFDLNEWITISRKNRNTHSVEIIWDSIYI